VLSAFENVISNLRYINILLFIIIIIKIAGTATEETWPGVTRFPEYNSGNDQ